MAELEFKLKLACLLCPVAKHSCDYCGNNFDRLLKRVLTLTYPHVILQNASVQHVNQMLNLTQDESKSIENTLSR